MSEALEKLHQLAWVASQQRINLDGLIISRLEISPSFSCQQANALEGACFVEGYRHLGFHEALFSEFLQRLRENAPLLAVCLAQGEKLSPETMPTVISVVTSSLYANFLLGDDPCGQGFQVDLPQVHGRVMQNLLMVWATHGETRRVSESEKVGPGPPEKTG